MTTYTTDQRNYKIGDNDNADPDSCTFGAENAPRANLALGAKAMIRIQVANDGPDSTGNTLWQLYYNTVDNSATASQVTTVTNPQMVDGQPSDGDPCDARQCSEQAETWMNGLYCESDDTAKLALTNAYYTEFQFCIQFNAGASETYYFYLRYADNVLTGTYDNVVTFTDVGVSAVKFKSFWGKYWWKG